MKTLTKIIAVLFLIAAPFVLTAQSQLYNSGIGGGEGSNPMGGGAPITGSFMILLSLGIGYGAKKVYDIRKGVVE